MAATLCSAARRGVEAVIVLIKLDGGRKGKC